MEAKRMRVVVVGAGLAGMSAAIRLAAEGNEIILVEKGDRVGGKLNIREGLGFRFDTGPSILTMPWVLEQLFSSAGKNLHEYLKLVRVTPEWRAFWPDGTRMNMESDLVGMMNNLHEFSPGEEDHLLDYLNHAQKLYQLTKKGFYKQTIRGLADLRRLHSWKELLAMDPMKTVHQTTSQYFNSEKVQQLFDFLVMYVGSSPYDAPAILTQLAHVQLGLGVWYIEGGLYNLARAEQRVLEELGVKILLQTEVERIDAPSGVATGVILKDGSRMSADVVVCNLEVPTAWRTLLKDHPKRAAVLSEISKFSPSVSGLVLLLGLDTQYPELAHHNFFFSSQPEVEFSQVFQHAVPAQDPTIYIGVSARSDSTQAPVGKDNLFVLTHVPPLAEGEDWSSQAARYREVVLAKLEHMGLKDLRTHIEWEYQFTPNELKQLYGAHGGSIYGVVSDRKRNGGFKIANQSSEVRNLYFVGGSTHPGGGVPMVSLSGYLTAQAILSSIATPVR